MDEAQLNDIIAQLMGLAEGALEAGHLGPYFDYMAAVFSLRDWQKAGMEGEMPVDLRKLGIRLPGVPSPAAEVVSTTKAEPEVAAPKPKPEEETDVQEVRRLLTKPDRQLSDIEEGLRKAEALLEAPLAPNVEAQARQWYNDGRRERAELQARVSVAEGVAAMGRYAEAIREYEDMIRAGQLEMRNCISGEVVYTPERLHQLREEYRDLCHQKAIKYLSEAEQFLPAFPRSAAHKLQQALDEFGEMPEEDRTCLQARLAEVNEVIERWNEAKNLIDQAVNTHDPRQHLTLLRQARHRYPEYESIDKMITKAEKDLVMQTWVEISDVLHRVEGTLTKGNVEEAEALYLEAREQIHDVLEAMPETLAQQLENVHGLLTTARQEEARQQEIAAAIEDAIEQAEYKVAAQLLAELSAEDRQRPRLEMLERRLLQLAEELQHCLQILRGEMP